MRRIGGLRCALRMIDAFIFFFFFFNDTATTEIYTLSLHDALPISRARPRAAGGRAATVDPFRLGAGRGLSRRGAARRGAADPRARFGRRGRARRAWLPRPAAGAGGGAAARRRRRGGGAHPARGGGRPPR